MRKNLDGSLLYSPFDLIVFMESEFASWMDRFNKEFPYQFLSDEADAGMVLLQTKGIEHEAKYLQQLQLSAKDVCEIVNGPDGHADTLEAMKRGRDVIYQGELKNGDFAGRADFLVKVPGTSRLGDFHYEVWDTKLSRKSKPYFLIQLCCYSEMLEAVQGRLSEYVGIILGDLTEKRFRTADYLYYYHRLQKAFREYQENFNAVNRPVPDGMIDNGRWSSIADEILEEIDHLSRVANIRKAQITKLEKAQIERMRELATAQVRTVSRMEPATFSTLRTQARLQLESVELSRPKYELIEITDTEVRRGLRLLSPASKNDLFFDMEGYPHVQGGLEYLFGASFLDHGKLH